MVKKVAIWGLIAFLVFYIVTQPAKSAEIAGSLGNGVVDIADGFTNFVNNLSS
jgi:hypothetical protein